MTAALQISGLTPLTTIDYPDHLACVVYTQGCPLRCGYCQNPHLIPFVEGQGQLSWSHVMSFLEQRKGMLEAVVFSGGEPTLQPGLRTGILSAIELGYKVGLHTAGVSASSLAKLLGLVDWIGLDVKAPENLYQRVTGKPNQHIQNVRSLELLLDAGTAFECRTTVDWRLLQPEDLIRLAELLVVRGVTRYAVQMNHGGPCYDPTLREAVSIPGTEKVQLQATLNRLFPHFEWRE